MNEKVNARIQALEAELEGLKKDLVEPKKEGRFRAKIDERYKTLVIEQEGKIQVFISEEDNHIVDNSRYDSFNYFHPDTDEADRMAEKINLLLAMTARVKELNGDWVADWEDNNEKFGLIIYNNIVNVGLYSTLNPFIFNLSVQSKKHAEILLNEFKERIERWY